MVQDHPCHHLNMQSDFYDRVHTLRQMGDPFVIATVVRAEKPTSAKAGAKALITEDGQLSGWIGGSCAEPTVKREAKKALLDGQPRLIRLCPPEHLGTAPQEGVIEIALTCISGGTLEIYIEPQMAQPHLIVIGHLATAEALITLAKGMGWRTSLLGLDVNAERFPNADQLVDELNFQRIKTGPNSHVVIASHGNYDEDMLVAALQSVAPYVTLIASHKRAAAILQYLKESNLSEDQIARLKFPAGLDLGAITPEEIALSILAEIVQFRRRKMDRVQAEANPSMLTLSIASSPVTEAIDPVCGMSVDVASAHFTSEYQGETYYFCAAGCKRNFDKEPGKYIRTETPKL